MHTTQSPVPETATSTTGVSTSELLLHWVANVDVTPALPLGGMFQEFTPTA